MCSTYLVVVDDTAGPKCGLLGGSGPLQCLMNSITRCKVLSNVAPKGCETTGIVGVFVYIRAHRLLNALNVDCLNVVF